MLFKSMGAALVKVFQVIALAAAVSLVLHAVFFVGYTFGYTKGVDGMRLELEKVLESDTKASSTVPEESTVPTPTPSSTKSPSTATQNLPNWSGPELWEAVNKKRQELGVNSLSNLSELCTIASIRLNELLDLGKLDGHEGFSNLPERREDLKWIFEKYNIAEFLVSGAGSAAEAVNLWENTLGHRKLLTGGEYVWGCAYAQNSFGVAIAAY